MRAARQAGRLLVGVVVVATLGGGCSGGGGRPEVAAVVEGAEIRSAETEALVDTYLGLQTAQADGKGQSRDQVAKHVLGYQIKVAFLEHLASAMGIPAAPKSYFDAAATRILQPEAGQVLGERQEDFARDLRAGQLSQAIATKLFPEVPVSDEAVRAEYEQRAAALERHWTATVRIARFAEREAAQQVARRVAQGEPFDGATAALDAEGVGSVEVNPLVAPVPGPILEAIGRLQAGEVSDAIPARGGWLAVLVERRRDVPQIPLDELRAPLTETLAKKERFGRFQQWFGRKFAKARITVDEHYGEWNARSSTVT